MANSLLKFFSRFHRQVNRPEPKRSNPPFFEIITLGFGLLALFAINLMSATLSPPPWGDEVMLSDPAIRCHLGQGFTSTAWAGQDGLSFFSCNVPLYPVFLAKWIEIFGLSLAHIRAFSYACFSAGILVIWLAVLRFGLLKSPFSRMALCGLLCTAFGMVFMYRSARYDALTFLLAAVTFFIWASPKNPTRFIFLLLTGFLAPWTGIQLLPYAIVLIALVFFLQKPRPYDRMLPLFLGMTVGLIALLVLYFYHGTYRTFIESILGHGLYFKVADKGWITKIFTLPHAFVGNPFELWQTDRLDPSSAIVFALVLLYAGYERFKCKKIRLPTLFALLLSLLLPCVFHGTVHFRIYYRWMLMVPCAICCFIFLEENWRGLSRSMKFASVGLLLIACFAGLPARMLFLGISATDRNYSQIELAVSSQIKPSDVVYADAIGYFAAAQNTKRIFSEGYLLRMTKEEKNQVTAVVINGHDADSILKALQGNWVKIFSLAEKQRIFIGSYSLEVYRRDSAHISTQ